MKALPYFRQLIGIKVILEVIHWCLFGPRSLTETINKKDKKANVKPFMVKNYLSVFINCMIENPAFDSQVGVMGRSPVISV